MPRVVPSVDELAVRREQRRTRRQPERLGSSGERQSAALSGRMRPVF
ncbi:MAG: hypothetical protein ACXVUE_06470 [Solirubrobacteraceae bacterium]